MKRNRTTRRGHVIVSVAISSVVLSGFAAFAVDMGRFNNVRAELQRTADAAALAAAGQLATGKTRSEAEQNALTAAGQVAGANKVFHNGAEVKVEDIVFGTYSFDENTGKYGFVPNTSGDLSAVRVKVRRTDVGYIFGRVLGFDKVDLSAEATSVLQARDISVVIDLSGSMKHDSYLRFYDKTQINARDIWASLDGPVPARPYIPGAEHETQYADDTGPMIGVMDLWGNPINPATYDPTKDPGLWHLPKGSACTIPEVAEKLTARGYTANEMSTVMSATNDTTEWRNRTAVMLGLAEWNSSGSSDSSVGSSELTWLSFPSYRKNWQWTDYLDWAAESNSKLTRVHPQFQYRFGLKTYVDFLLDRKDNHSQTDLTMTPEQPLTAVKDAVQVLVDSTGAVDYASLETFGSTSRHEVDLSGNRQAVADTLYGRQANHWDNSTNIGDGLGEALTELTGPRARNHVRKVIVLMSDGAHNTGSDPLPIATAAAEQGVTIYTVSVGYGVDRPLMQEIAEIGKGREFYAAGTPETYSSQLRSIFKKIGGSRHAVLIH